MAGGKGKSSGGKSSGGKVGVDGSKKQQSHSSKAGLQVSSARSWNLLHRGPFCVFGGFLKSASMLEVGLSPPRQVASHHKQQRDGWEDWVLRGR